MSTFQFTFPPTPEPSILSAFEFDDPNTYPNDMADDCQASPTSTFGHPISDADAHFFPPTPPSMDSSRAESPVDRPHYAEQLRNRRARRPVSVNHPHQQPPFLPPRKYTDPTPHSRSFLEEKEELSPNPQQLDVDLDAYSITDDETVPGATLSFVTTSTESTTSTPPIGNVYGAFKPDNIDSKEPRIRMRTTTGRANAYSSAESSMGSGAYSYHSYSDNHVYHPHPPPLPAMPLAYAHEAERVGLGLNTVLPHRFSPTGSSSGLPDSPATSYQHRPWHRDVSKHIRNESASTTTTSSGSDDGLGATSSPDAMTYHFNGYNLSDHIPWGGVAAVEKEAKALLTVEEGRETIFDAVRLGAMGGVGALSDEAMRSLAGVTHLLLPNIGSSILPILPSLIAVLAPSLLVADLSDNDLSFLPESLRHSTHLEELNINNNPLRQLPVWMSELGSLHVLAVDGCGLAGIPAEMSQLNHLHTICARRNKLTSLPAWLCLLSQLETLRVDDNPFAPEWCSVVQPILAGPSRIARPAFRDTPQAPSLSSSSTSSVHKLASVPSSSADPVQTVYVPLRPIAEDNHPHSAPLRPDPIKSPATSDFVIPFGGGNRLRKMRSAGTLLNIRSVNVSSPVDDHLLSPTSAGPTLQPPSAGRFDGLGSAVGRRASTSTHEEEPVSAGMTASTSGKSHKWGFLRKMSMQRLRGDKPSLTASASSNVKLMPPPLKHNDSEPGPSRPLPPRPAMLTVQSAMTLPTRQSVGIEDEISEFGAGSRLQAGTLPAPSSSFWAHGGATARKPKRRSFLPLDNPPTINIQIPSASPFMPSAESFHGDRMEVLPTLPSEETIADDTLTASSSLADELQAISDADSEARYAQGLESIKSYLRDLFDLSRPVIEPYGGFEMVPDTSVSNPGSPASGLRSSIADRRRQQSILEKHRSGSPLSLDTAPNDQDFAPSEDCGKKFKNDPSKRARILREIYETYVRGLGELVNIYVRPSGLPVKPGQTETVVPAAERKIVFGGIESILTIHRENLLPALEKAVKPLLEGTDDEAGELSAHTAHVVGEVFRTYITYMKQYSTYINNFDNALSRMQSWIATSGAVTPSFGKSGSPTIASIAGLAASSGAGSVGMSPTTSLGADGVPHSGGHMNKDQKRRVKHFLQKCRQHPLHSQINLESYLLLPVQRVPRYKLLLEDLAMCTPPSAEARDALDDALNEIAGLASLMNEEKRDSESRLRLYHWQKRITSRGPSPLVQPHRKLIIDGTLTLIRLVKKASSFIEVDTTLMVDGDATVMPSKAVVPVEHLHPEPMDRQMALILCSDLMVLVQPRSGSAEGMVDLYNVLRMSTVREPASIVYGDVLRVVDNKSIYYFSGSSPTNILEWCRAINSARRR